MVASNSADKSYWLKHVEAYRVGGFKSKYAYCSESGIKYHQFLYWYGKLIKELVNKGVLPREELFMPVKLTSIFEGKNNHGIQNNNQAKFINNSQSQMPLCILELKQDHRLLIYDESVLEKLIALLNN